MGPVAGTGVGNGLVHLEIGRQHHDGGAGRGEVEQIRDELVPRAREKGRQAIAHQVEGAARHALGEALTVALSLVKEDLVAQEGAGGPEDRLTDEAEVGHVDG